MAFAQCLGALTSHVPGCSTELYPMHAGVLWVLSTLIGRHQDGNVSYSWDRDFAVISYHIITQCICPLKAAVSLLNVQSFWTSMRDPTARVHYTNIFISSLSLCLKPRETFTQSCLDSNDCASNRIEPISDADGVAFNIISVTLISWFLPTRAANRARTFRYML